ncbi:MAG TPA: hypothetical protein VF062_09675 [Candidatus Limnocylindrales bacterium]
MSVLLSLMLAVPMWLHGGPVTLTVAGDGAGGVTVQAVYQKDGHPAETLRLVLTAAGESGRSVGPTQLAASMEGRGFYSSGHLLTPGRWEVTVTSPEPNPGAATITVHALAPQTPPAGVSAPAGGATGGPRWWPAAPVAAAVAVAAVVGVWWWRKKKHHHV